MCSYGKRQGKELQMPDSNPSNQTFHHYVWQLEQPVPLSSDPPCTALSPDRLQFLVTAKMTLYVVECKSKLSNLQVS